MSLWQLNQEFQKHLFLSLILPFIHPVSTALWTSMDKQRKMRRDNCQLSLPTISTLPLLKNIFQFTTNENYMTQLIQIWTHNIPWMQPFSDDEIWIFQSSSSAFISLLSFSLSSFNRQWFQTKMWWDNYQLSLPTNSPLPLSKHFKFTTKKKYTSATVTEMWFWAKNFLYECSFTLAELFNHPPLSFFYLSPFISLLSFSPSCFNSSLNIQG